jgi:hypothetical protein
MMEYPCPLHIQKLSLLTEALRWWCMAYPALGAILFGSDGAARVFSPSRF